MASFQKTQANQPAPAVEGDFAGANPTFSMLAGAGQLTAGAPGLTVGRFAWADATSGIATNAHPGTAGARLGFVGRHSSPALITTWLAAATMVIPTGIEANLFRAADVWGRFAGGASIGQKVYASYIDGSLSAAATATPTTEGITASLDNATSHMTVTVAGANPIGPGMPVAGTGVGAGNTIASQVSGTPGGVGVYLLTIAPTTEAAEAITVTLNQETPWVVDSPAAAGELAMIAVH